LKVIGAGFGRTGTMSLKAALERLGFGPCYHMTEVFGHPEHNRFWVSSWRGEPAD
jgi:Sulfotransferase domain